MDNQPDSVDKVLDALQSQDVNFPDNKQMGNQSADDLLSDDKETDEKKRIGTLVISTTGGGSSIQVPHKELSDEMKNLGFPNGFIPDKTTPRKAFTRAKQSVIDNFSKEVTYNGKSLSFEMWPDGHYIQMPVASYVESDKVKTITLGKFEFNPETKEIERNMNSKIGDTILSDIWNIGFVKPIEEQFLYHQSHLIADDISMLQRKLQSKAQGSIQLRRAVYFYPDSTKGLDEVFRMYKKLYDWLDKYKIRGDTTEFYWTPLFNRETDKNFVADKLEEHIESEIESLVDDVIHEMTNDKTAQVVARETLSPVLQELDSTIEEYEIMSDITPQIKRKLKNEVHRRKPEVSERAREVVKSVENQSKLTDIR